MAARRAVQRADLSRRQALTGYDFQTKFLALPDRDLGPLRMHYVDQGPRDGPLIVLLHGEPTWSYLYRNVIPPLVDAGCRVMAPDLVGFGFSDKPVDEHAHEFGRHVHWLGRWVEVLDLQRITLFGQGWGGMLGLCVLTRHLRRFRRVMVANTYLPTGDEVMSAAFRQWVEFCERTADVPVGRVVQGGTVRELSADELAAYEAPFADVSAKAGVLALPSLVPTSPDHPAAGFTRMAWGVLDKLEIPVATVFSDQDSLTEGWGEIFAERIPGAAEAPHEIIEGAGHYLQEDAPERLVELLRGFLSVGE